MRMLQKRPLQHVTPRVHVVHVLPPIVVQTDVSHFRTTVQKLTGWETSTPSGSSDVDEPEYRAHRNYPLVSSNNDEDQCSNFVDVYDELFCINACVNIDDEFESGDDHCVLRSTSNEDILNERLLDRPLGLPMLSNHEDLSVDWTFPSISSSCHTDSVLLQQHQQDATSSSRSSEYRWDWEESPMMLPIHTNPMPSPPLQKLQLTYTQSFGQSPRLVAR